MDATARVAEVKQRDAKNGTIYTIVDGNGNDFLTKNHSLATLAKSAKEAGKQIKIQYTVLPGREKDDGSRWPDSKWVDKDGIEVVEPAPEPARGGGGMSPADILRVTKLSAMSSACTLLAGRQDVTPSSLQAISDFIVAYAYGEADASDEPDEPAPLETVPPASDDIPF